MTSAQLPIILAETQNAIVIGECHAGVQFPQADIIAKTGLFQREMHKGPTPLPAAFLVGKPGHDFTYMVESGGLKLHGLIEVIRIVSKWCLPQFIMYSFIIPVLKLRDSAYSL